MNVDNYPNLTNLIKINLCLSHRNADVERGFSFSSLTLDESRASMSERTLNARLNTCYALKIFYMKPEDFPTIKELVKLTLQSNKSYKSFLENEKQIMIQDKIKKKHLEIDKIKQDEVKENLLIRKNVEDLEKQLEDSSKNIKESSVLLNSLIKQTNEKLKNEIVKRI